MLLNLLRRLLEVKEPECRGCSIYKEQLEVTRFEKEQLLNTLIELVKPKSQDEVAMPTTAKLVDALSAMRFTRRRSMLEERDAIAAKAVRESPFSAERRVPKPIVEPSAEEASRIEKLERELGVVTDTGVTEREGENKEEENAGKISKAV